MNGKRAKSIRRFVDSCLLAGVVPPERAKTDYKKIKRRHVRRGVR